MSRFVAAFGTTAAPGRSCNAGAVGTPAGSFGLSSSTEGLVIGLDGLSIVASKAAGGSVTCNGAADDCDAATEPNAGLATTQTISGLTDLVRYPGGTYTFTNWRDVLRVVFAGMEIGDSNNLTLRDCNRELRRRLADNYGLLFKTGTCAPSPTEPGTTNCTQLRHAFIRDNESGTTDAFVSLLGLPSVSLPTNVSPFCNALRAADPVPAGVARYSPDFQDFDPVRRACDANEEVCHRTASQLGAATRWGLGLVVTVNAADFIVAGAPISDAFPVAPCVSFELLPLIPPSLPPLVRRCPNGDTPFFGSLCFIPKSAAGSFKCLNPNTLKPALINEQPPVPIEGRVPAQADGRVYNLHLLKDPPPGSPPGTPPTYELDGRGRQMEGAFYRVHATRSFTAGVTCQQKQATSQIGCLVAASPCSIGFAGREAVSATAQTESLNVNGLYPTLSCITTQAYPLNRKLYVNSFLGFEGSATLTQERELARCFADRTKIDTILTNRNFVPLPVTNPLTLQPLNPFCEDFRETQCGNLGNPANFNACGNNGAVGLPGSNPGEFTICGNGTREYGEQCDDGNNVNLDGCNAFCQNEN
jgi:cysteine-rich repeat protein